MADPTTQMENLKGRMLSVQHACKAWQKQYGADWWRPKYEDGYEIHTPWDDLSAMVDGWKQWSLANGPAIELAQERLPGLVETITGIVEWSSNGGQHYWVPVDPARALAELEATKLTIGQPDNA